MATRVDINLTLAQKIAADAAERGMRAVVIEAQNLTRIELSKPGSGRIYPRGKTGTHQASAPGEPPAPDTGDLRRKIDVEVVRTGDTVTGYVIANSEYAAGLELGTERVRPRPFLSTVARQYGDRLRAVFAQFARVP